MKNPFKRIIIEDPADKGAVISADDKYRYALWRVWNHHKPCVLFIMLNPSTADASKDDPTIKKCISYAKKWGYGGLYVGNLYAFRSRDPKALGHEDRPVGVDNDAYLQWMKDKCEMIIAAWGNNILGDRRAEEVRFNFSPMNCLELTKSGRPKHPLYLGRNCKLMKYS
jgi:hypothetical protein